MNKPIRGTQTNLLRRVCGPLSMRTEWPIIVAVSLTLTGCSPDQLVKRINADALAAVQSHMDKGVSARLRLRVEGNPWGTGCVVFDTTAADVEHVLIWFYSPDVSWSIPPSPNRSEAFALDARASELTPRLRRLEAADEKLQHYIGVEGVSSAEVRETVLYSIRQGVNVHDARSELSRRSKVAK